MRYIYIFFILLLNGCASAPKGALTFEQVDIPVATSEESIFIFHRLFTPPAGSDMRVSINDQQLVALPNNTFSYLKLKPGKFKLKISWSPWTGMGSNEKTLTIKPNETLYLQLNSSVWTPMGVQLGSNSNDSLNKEIAENILKECCKYIRSTEL